MKQIIISIWIALLTLPVFAQQQMQAKVVLDKTAATFEKTGGIRAEFNVTVFTKAGWPDCLRSHRTQRGKVCTENRRWYYLV